MRWLSQDKRVSWFDMDLSTKPYRVLRYHTGALTGVCFHRTYPLFASASTDASAHVFHGMVYQVCLQHVAESVSVKAHTGPD